VVSFKVLKITGIYTVDISSIWTGRIAHR